MRNIFRLKIGFRFSTQQNPFDTFINSKKQQLHVKRNAGRNSLGTEVHVPYKSIDKNKIKQFFQERQITNKNILINIDCSHLLGMTRLVMNQYLQQNVYKGYGQTTDILKKHNPSQYVQLQEILFNQTVFAITDPIFINKAKSTKTKIQNLLPEIQQYYKNQANKGIERLYSQYKVPKQYLNIIQIANNMQNNIYFIGINQYQMRQILSSYLTLKDIKILFMQCLKYTQKISELQFYHKNKEYLWKKYYSFLQPINYQCIMNARQQIKGYCFANSYHFIKPQTPSINFKDLKDKQPDSSKIEKHAILQVLFGNLWNKPYTRNSFPYLTQKYMNLTKDDQMIVIDCYNNFYNTYTNVKDKFYSK